jgi:hypothetical protein
MIQQSHFWGLKFSIDKRFKNYSLSMLVFPVMHVGRLRYKIGPEQNHQTLDEKQPKGRLTEK